MVIESAWDTLRAPGIAVNHMLGAQQSRADSAPWIRTEAEPAYRASLLDPGTLELLEQREVPAATRIELFRGE